MAEPEPSTDHYPIPIDRKLPYNKLVALRQLIYEDYYADKIKFKPLWDEIENDFATLEQQGTNYQTVVAWYEHYNRKYREIIEATAEPLVKVGEEENPVEESEEEEEEEPSIEPMTEKTNEELQNEVEEERERNARLLEVTAIESVAVEKYIAMLLSELKKDNAVLTPEQQLKLAPAMDHLRQLMNENETMKEDLKKVNLELTKANRSAEGCQAVQQGKKSCFETTEELQTRIRDQQLEIDQLAAEKDQEISKLVRELRREKDGTAEQIRQCEKRGDEAKLLLQSELDDLTEVNATLQAKLRGLDMSNDVLTRVRQTQFARLEEKERIIDDRNARIQELETEKDIRESRFATLNQQLLDCNRRREALIQATVPKISDNAIADLNQELNELNLEIEKKNNELIESQSKNDEYRLELVTLQNARGVAENKHQQLMTELETLRTTTQTQQQSIDQLNTERGELEGQIKALQTALETEKRTCEEIRVNWIKAQQLTEDFNSEIRERDNTILDLEQTIKRIQLVKQELGPTQSDYDSKIAEIVNLEQALDAAKKRYDTLELRYEIVQKQNEIIRQSGATGEPMESTKGLIDRLQALKQTVSLDCAEQTREMTNEIAVLKSAKAALLQMPYIELDGNFNVRGSLHLSNAFNNGQFFARDYRVLPNTTFSALIEAAKQRRRAIKDETSDDETIEDLPLGAPLTLGQTINRMGYSALVKQRVDGPLQLRLAFEDGRALPRLEMTVNGLAPRVLDEGAPPELVADISRNGRKIAYKFVTQLDRDLIPAKGRLTLTKYNGAVQLTKLTQSYTLHPPLVEQPYGTESMFEFSDGTRLYATYVTASLYAANIIVTPFHALTYESV